MGDIISYIGPLGERVLWGDRDKRGAVGSEWRCETRRPCRGALERSTAHLLDVEAALRQLSLQRDLGGLQLCAEVAHGRVVALKVAPLAVTGALVQLGARQRLRQLADLVLVLPAALTQLRGDTEGGGSTGGWERGDTGGRKGRQQGGMSTTVNGGARKLWGGAVHLNGDMTWRGGGDRATGGWGRGHQQRGRGEQGNEDNGNHEPSF